MKKIALLTILFLEFSEASTLDKINISLSNVLLATLAVIIIVLLIILQNKNKNIANLNKVVEEKDEKIQWLRKVFAQKESSLNKTIKELEKGITELNHTIDNLEQKLKEGTKNQVVAKLESLERKREELLHKLKDK